MIFRFAYLPDVYCNEGRRPLVQESLFVPVIPNSPFHFEIFYNPTLFRDLCLLYP